jgi:RimJ/RimL family protein N-acetyltransferase
LCVPAQTGDDEGSSTGAGSGSNIRRCITTRERGVGCTFDCEARRSRKPVFVVALSRQVRLICGSGLQEELFIWSAIPFIFPLDEDQLERHIQEAQSSKPWLMYTAVDSQMQEYIGHIELTGIDQENRKASIAYVLVDPAKRGLRYLDGLVQSIMAECFQIMKMLKVDLFVFEFNPVAIHCYQKAGFEIEEVIGDRIKLRDNFVIHYLMGLSYEKWNASKSPAGHN